MPVHFRWTLLFFGLPCLAGCGTISNLDGFSQTVWIGLPTEVPRPLGGVANDCRMIEVMAGSGLGWLAIPPLVVDLPLSLVGDVVTLPKVMRMRREWVLATETGNWPEWAKFYPHPRLVESKQTQPAEGEVRVAPAEKCTTPGQP